MRAADLEPLEPYPGKAIDPWRCRCNVCDREVCPRYNDVQQGKRCAYCAGIRVDPAEAHAVMVAAGLTPFGAYPGGHMPWHCVCNNCGNSVMPTYSSVKMGRGCRLCGLERTAAARRIGPAVAEQLMRDVGLEPLVEYPGSRDQWLCRCMACGNDVTPTYDSVNQGGGGCLFCASGGYDPFAPGAVYLIRHEVFGAYKVGIRNVTSSRIQDHVRTGWVLVDEWMFDDGKVAPVIEAEVLDWWRGELEAPYACTPEQMPQAGHTETVSMQIVSEEAIMLMISIVAGRQQVL